MKVSRGVETSVEVGVDKKTVDNCRCRETNHHIKRRSSIDRPSCQEAIEEIETFLIDSPSVEIAIRKKKLESSTDSQVSRRCRASF